MTKLTIAFFLFATSVTAHAGPACEKFRAFMSSKAPGCPYIGVKVAYQTAGEEMTITIYSGRDYWNEYYIADGATHDGDGDFTGKSYSVNCGEQDLVIRREEVFGANLTDTYTLRDGGLDYISQPDGAANAVRCRFEP